MSKTETEMVQTSIVVPRAIWKGLRALAEAHAAKAGGRPNVSAVVARLAHAELARTRANRATDVR